MDAIKFEDDAIQVDAEIVATGLGIAPAALLQGLRDGTITSVCERGVDADDGRHRLTFFSRSCRFRLVIDKFGLVVQRSALDFRDRPLPASAHRTA